MSRFLKFIVHLIVILIVVCILGLTLPPFFGVTTVVVDDAQEKTNLPMGSVTYAIPQKTEEVYVGEPILVQEDSSTYRYEVQTINPDNGTGTVIDPTVTGAQPITVAVREYVPKVVITIAYVGYLLVATKTLEGRIILGLAVLFLVILYIIAELWKKDSRDYDDDEINEITEDDEEEAPGYVKTRKELKKEEKERAKRSKAEEEEEVREEPRPAKKKKKTEKRKVRTGGFVDEIDEDDDEYEDDYEEEPVTMQPAESEAHELLRKEIAAATAEDAEEDVRTVPSAELIREELSGIRNEEAPRKKTRKVRRRANPGYSASELAKKAKDAGDNPDVVKDDVTDVTLFDYSDILEDEE